MEIRYHWCYLGVLLNNFTIILSSSDCQINQRENTLQTNGVDLTLDVPQSLHTLYLDKFLVRKLKQNSRACLERFHSSFTIGGASFTILVGLPSENRLSSIVLSRTEVHSNIFTFFKSRNLEIYFLSFFLSSPHLQKLHFFLVSTSIWQSPPLRQQKKDLLIFFFSNNSKVLLPNMY